MRYYDNRYVFALDYKRMSFPYFVNTSQLVISRKGNAVGMEDVQLLETAINLNWLTQF